MCWTNLCRLIQVVLKFKNYRICFTLILTSLVTLSSRKFTLIKGRGAIFLLFLHSYVLKKKFIAKMTPGCDSKDEKWSFTRMHQRLKRKKGLEIIDPRLEKWTLKVIQRSESSNWLLWGPLNFNCGCQVTFTQ